MEDEEEEEEEDEEEKEKWAGFAKPPNKSTGELLGQSSMQILHSNTFLLRDTETGRIQTETETPERPIEWTLVKCDLSGCHCFGSNRAIALSGAKWRVGCSDGRSVGRTACLLGSDAREN